MTKDFRERLQRRVTTKFKEIFGLSKPTKVKIGPKISRNAPCPCGSGKKYKNCCSK